MHYRLRLQAYFNSNGLLLKYLSSNAMPFLQGFKSKIKDINGLNYVAKDFDRTFMNELSKEQWKSISDSFTYNVNDEVIKNAARQTAPQNGNLKSIGRGFCNGSLPCAHRGGGTDILVSFHFVQIAGIARAST